MKSLLVNTNDFGGAAIACLRLNKGLLQQDIQSNVLLKRDVAVYKRDLSFFEKAANKIRRVGCELKLLKEETDYLKGKPDGFYPFTLPYTNIDLTKNIYYQESEVVNLHWVADFLDWKSFFLKNRKPVVWTLHDMNPFTGGCHHSLDCYKYKSKCFECPQLKGTINNSYSDLMLSYKEKVLGDGSNVHIVCPSKWLMKSSKRSKLFSKFPHYHIPNSLDTKRFKIFEKSYSRDILGIPKNKVVLSFIAGFGEKLKGGGFIKEASSFITKKFKNVVFCNLGNKSIEMNNVLNIKNIKDERFMPLFYSASDVLVIPSIAENLPNVIMEAFSCGIPVIGFPVGGIPDMIREGVNGYLTEEISASSLIETITRFLDAPDVFDKLKIRDDAISRYDLSVQAKAYIKLYKGIINS